MLKQFLFDLRPQDSVECFTDSALLVREMQSGAAFDCLFLDILMPGRNGLDLASSLREEFSGQSLHIIFITSSRDYAVEAFARRAIHYIVKPIRLEDVAESLDRIPAQSAKRLGITVKYGSVTRFLYLDEITAIESRDHDLNILLKSGETIVYRASLESIRTYLGDDFIQLSRGIIVNLGSIAIMEKRSCVLTDGRKILLSRRNLQQIHDVYDNYVFSRLVRGQRRSSPG